MREVLNPKVSQGEIEYAGKTGKGSYKVRRLTKAGETENPNGGFWKTESFE